MKEGDEGIEYWKNKSEVSVVTWRGRMEEGKVIMGWTNKGNWTP
jgi:hypothetical protein